MPNEFEKQVQQMMDELKLVPSEPVWQKVEMQIRNKKDRRRLIFWMIFLALLLGGGMWFGLSEYSNQISYKNDSAKGKEIRKAAGNNSPAITTPKSTDQKTEQHTTTTTPGNKTKDERIKEANKVKDNGFVLEVEPTLQDNVSKKIRAIKENPARIKKEAVVKIEKPEPDKIAVTEVTAQKLANNNLKQSVPNSNTILQEDTITIVSGDTKQNETNEVAVTDSVKQDTTASKSEAQKQDTGAVLKKGNIKKYATSKWKLNFIALAGSSGISDVSLFEGLFGSGEKSLAAPNYSGGSATGGSPLYYGPSDIQEGFSFSIGAVAKKQLAKRTFFSTGMRYNYYSNTILVGNKINQSRVLMDFAVSQYYSNTGFSLQPYHNRYHFVSLPVAIDWQLLKKIPLNFYTGLSIQYLIKTNGLVFDYTSQSYFNSKDAFNRVQLFFEPALTYSVSFKQKVLTFGPQLQYGLTRLEKNNSTYHLTSYGLKAQFQLGKK